MGASAFGAVGKFANSAIGTIASEAVELTGGNFWQGALIGGVVAGLNHTLHMEKTAVEDSPDNGYDKNGKKINNNGGDTTDYLYDEKGKIIGSTSVKISTFQGGEVSSNMEGYGYRMRTIGSGGTLYDPSFDIAVTEIGGGIVFKGLGIGGKYLLSNFNRITGGPKQWIRLAGDSYSHAGKFETFGTRWGAGGKYWKKIENPTLQKWNKAFRQTKLPGNNWRVKDPGHFHWWKK